MRNWNIARRPPTTNWIVNNLIDISFVAVHRQTGLPTHPVQSYGSIDVARNTVKNRIPHCSSAVARCAHGMSVAFTSSDTHQQCRHRHLHRCCCPVNDVDDVSLRSHINLWVSLFFTSTFITLRSGRPGITATTTTSTKNKERIFLFWSRLSSFFFLFLDFHLLLFGYTFFILHFLEFSSSAMPLMVVVLLLPLPRRSYCISKLNFCLCIRSLCDQTSKQMAEEQLSEFFAAFFSLSSHWVGARFFLHEISPKGGRGRYWAAAQQNNNSRFRSSLSPSLPKRSKCHGNKCVTYCAPFVQAIAIVYSVTGRIDPYLLFRAVKMCIWESETALHTAVDFLFFPFFRFAFRIVVDVNAVCHPTKGNPLIFRRRKLDWTTTSVCKLLRVQFKCRECVMKR